ncbi:hypothetical protein Golomagni_03443 [Golovinomyces magnicellulatus]|nr:hypothetical protein Golomagni_03443 [Golovinomyces magnicellulatus]
MHTPPITPAITRSQEISDAESKGLNLPQLPNVKLDPAAVTPQSSPPAEVPSTPCSEDSPAGTFELDTIPASPVSRNSRNLVRAFSIGPSTDSMTVSRDCSPARPSGSSTFSRPFAPAGDANDPYAANKRIPQNRNLDTLDSRFKFTAVNSKNRTSTSNMVSSNPSRSTKTADLNKVDKRSTRSFREYLTSSSDEVYSPIFLRKGSLVDLRRLFKLGPRDKSKSSNSIPTLTMKSDNKTKPKSNPTSHPSRSGDDHALQSKYGKFGKVLGAGAGGSVRLIKRSCDGKTFAVKEFRARNSCETEKDYTKKVTAEFCIGSTLHHGNIIETLDILCEKGKWYEVMEYAPYDLFAIVMTGKMSKDEITCSFLQILNAVTYLHSMGLAHRDLKLDNVVVNEHGIMKIIDFGSASVFKYPFESGITKASGIVGSDPYLAPEVYEEKKYDPQPADIWSLAIIFCCMSLRRFPWKLPRLSDNSYKLFASTPSPAPDRKITMDESASSKSTTDLYSVSNNSLHPMKKSSFPPFPSVPDANTSNPSPETEKKPEVIKGPWRLLRLLPRESRNIIGHMLKIDPKKRALMSEIIEDSWVSGTAICTRDEEGHVRHAPGHTHTLEPPAPPTGKPPKVNAINNKAKGR